MLEKFQKVIHKLLWISLISFCQQSWAKFSLDASLTCADFGEWKQVIDEMKQKDSLSYVKGKTSELNLIREEGYHPRLKQNYFFHLFGQVKRAKGGGLYAKFRMEASTPKMKRLVVRHFDGANWLWSADKKDKTKKLRIGKKGLVWAGGRGPTGLMLGKFPQWVDLGLSQRGDMMTSLGTRNGAMSEKGTIYYFPEGVLEIFTRKAPLAKSFQPRRIYLWSGGCVENQYPSPWPRQKK